LTLLHFVHRDDQRTKFFVEKNLISSMNSATADFLSSAASATATKRFGRSISRSPLSALPLSGSMSITA
jgi:hypothetical protein